MPSPEQETSAQRIAQAMASEIAPRVTTPGLRACFNRVASGVAVTLKEPDDLFPALTGERDFSQDWEEDPRRRDTELDEALVNYLQCPPQVLMEWLVRHGADNLVVNDLTADDIQNLDSCYAIRHAADSTREALFTHPNPVIRSNAAALSVAEWSTGANESPALHAWQVDQERCAAAALDQRADRRPARPDDQVAFPMARDGAVFGLSGALAQDDISSDMPLRLVCATEPLVPAALARCADT